jgi:hypothetical protein
MALWDQVFPQAKLTRAVLPVDRGVNLGDIFVRIWEVESDGLIGYHLVMNGEISIAVPSTLHEIDAIQLEDLGLDPPDWIIWCASSGGTGARSEDTQLRLSRLRMNWPEVSIVLYGPGVADVMDSLSHDDRARVYPLTPVYQGTLL